MPLERYLDGGAHILPADETLIRFAMTNGQRVIGIDVPIPVLRQRFPGGPDLAPSTCSPATKRRSRPPRAAPTTGPRRRTTCSTWDRRISTRSQPRPSSEAEDPSAAKPRRANVAGHSPRFGLLIREKRGASGVPRPTAPGWIDDAR
ncbi:hypothetical protein ACRBEV_17465 [Methylobacterium phyllosphaerae]